MICFSPCWIGLSCSVGVMMVEMKAYYTDDYCTIYHGVDSSCCTMLSVVDCTHENIHTRRGEGDAAQYAFVFEETRAQRTDAENRSAQGLQTVTGAHRRAYASWGKSSCMGRGRSQRKGGEESRSEAVSECAVFVMRSGSRGAPPHRRKHTEQFTGERGYAVQAVPHAEGWSS